MKTESNQVVLTAGDGARLHASWSGDGNRSRGVVAVVHGLCEHKGRYGPLAAALNRSGVTVAAMDLRGHGLSTGRRGHAASYEQLLDDMDLYLDWIAQQWTLPRVLLGHSLGGGLVLNHALRRAPGIAGIVALSPLLQPTTPPPWWKVGPARFLNRVWPAFQFRTGVRPYLLTHDVSMQADIRNDPLRHPYVSARLAVSMFDAGLWALENATNLALPTLILHGERDPLTDPDSSRRFSAQAGSLCHFESWPGALHELCSETERHRVFRRIAEWVCQTIDR